MLALIGLLAVLPSAAFAHGVVGGALPWTFEAWTVAPLGLAGGLLAAGAWRLARRSGRGAALLRRRLLMLALGWGSLVLALVSPLAAAGHVAFSAHMAQHEVLMLLAAPLLVLGRPVAVLAWALPEAGRRAFGGLARAGVLRALTAPVFATLLQSAVLWIWHAPQLFGRGLADPAWHAAQHLSFFGSALLFWVAMLDRCAPSLAGRGMAALCLFATSLVSGALGALMALSESPWYAGYARLGLTPMGLTPAEDQQLAGLLMWVPGGLVHAGAALVLLASAFRNTAEVAHARQS